MCNIHNAINSDSVYICTNVFCGQTINVLVKARQYIPIK